MPARPHVFIATPCYGGLVTQGYMQSVVGLMAYAASHGFDLSLGLLGNDALITRARNTLLGQFLHGTEATHILFVDSDIAFAPEQVEHLLRAEKDVVAGMYPLKVVHWDERARARARAGEAMDTAPLLYVGLPCEGEGRRREGRFVAGRYAGTGFMMIRRQAVERMIAAHPELRYRNVHAYPLREAAGDQYALFDCMIDPATGDYLSEDFAFCRRWRDLGGEIWLDTEGALTHSGPLDFRGDVAARQA